MERRLNGCAHALPVEHDIVQTYLGSRALLYFFHRKVWRSIMKDGEMVARTACPLSMSEFKPTGDHILTYLT